MGRVENFSRIDAMDDCVELPKASSIERREQFAHRPDEDLRSLWAEYVTDLLVFFYGLSSSPTMHYLSGVGLPAPYIWFELMRT